MSEYIVSARKYRPQTFDTVVGQEHITTTLKNAIRSQHLAHAYLFCGPRGVGKTTCARILSKTINCLSPTADTEACGVCDICTSFKNNTSFNVFELDAASNNSVDDIRELTNQVRFAPQHGKYKVYIIDEVHMLSASAFNAFLKMLEEPPSYAIFILATTEKHKILPTILSRCQIFDFKRITTNDIVSHLQSIAAKESMVAQEAALHIIAQKSEGCMRDALSMLDRIASFTNGMLTYNNTMEHLNLLDADFYFAITDSILSQDVAATLLMLDNAMEKGFEGDVVIEGLAEHYRNLLLCKDIRMARLLDVPNEHKPVYLEKANQLPPSFILSALNVLNQCELEYKNATNRRLHVEMCLIRLCYLQSTINGLQLATADTEKKNSDQLTPPPAAPRQAPPPVAVPMQQQAPPPAATYPAEHMYSQPQTQFVAEPAAPVMPTGNPPTEPAVPAAASTRPARPANAGRRLTRDLLDMSEQNAGPAKEKKELTVGLAEELFKAFLAKLKAENKDSVAAQLDLTRREVFLPDEVKIIAPTKLAETILLNQRSLIQEFFQEQTNNAIRITNELIEDVSMVEAQRSVLSKSEQFEALVMKNPLLGMLRDSLGMQIEY